MPAVADAFVAVEQNDAAALERLLQEAPSLAGARNDAGLSLLLSALYRGAQRMVDLILAAKPALDVFDAAAVGDATRVEELLRADPALAAAYSPDGFSPLHLAAFLGHTDVAAVLLRHGAPAGAVSCNAMQVAPLHSAAAGQHHALCALLLDGGADVNARQQGGWTALHAAAQHGDQVLAELLLARGADPSLAREGGETPSETARAAGHPALAELLTAGL